ncbi:MAG TPA: VWA domain-containing protein [Bacteroidia bacterium]|nr:VWA domain-containing protein [Bacteroidia bacterium]
MTFANKPMFWLLGIIPLYIAWYVWKGKSNQGELMASTLDNLKEAPRTLRQYLRHVMPVLRSLSFALLIVILARPQSRSSWKNVSTEGINIVIALDISSSMLAQDLKPSRIEASKTVAMNFIDNRPNDRIGLVIFSGESFTQCPLTSDHAVLKNLFADIHTGMVADGTAIGMGLATAVSRIDTLVKSNVIILLTDGVNNQGAIDPLTAAEIAKAYKVRVYTVGLGSNGKALVPYAMDQSGKLVYDYRDVEIDEPMLKKVAAISGGKYFRATDTEKLKKIYQEIDSLEKNKIQEKNFSKHKELYLWPALGALLLLVLELVLRYTLFRSIT